MPVTFPVGGSDSLSMSYSLSATDFTMVFSVSIPALPSAGDYYTLVITWDNANPGRYIWIGVNDSGAVEFYGALSDDVSWFDFTSPVLTPGQTYSIAVSYDSAAQRTTGYVLSGSNLNESIATGDLGSVLDQVSLGTDGFPEDSTSGLTMSRFRVWKAVLSSLEIVAEMRAMNTIRTTNLYVDTPLNGDASDLNGHTWTVNGSPVFTTTPDEVSLGVTSTAGLTWVEVTF